MNQCEKKKCHWLQNNRKIKNLPLNFNSLAKFSCVISLSRKKSKTKFCEKSIRLHLNKLMIDMIQRRKVSSVAQVNYHRCVLLAILVLSLSEKAEPCRGGRLIGKQIFQADFGIVLFDVQH